MKLFKITLILICLSLLLISCKNLEEKSEETVEIIETVSEEVQLETYENSTEEQQQEDPDAIRIFVNDKRVQTTIPPEFKNGTMMLPFRDICNAFDITNEEIVWDAQKQSISVNHEGKFIFFIIDNVYAVANDKSVEMEAPAYIKENDLTMVSFRFIAEALNAQITWEGKDMKLIYN